MNRAQNIRRVIITGLIGLALCAYAVYLVACDGGIS